MVSHFPHFIEDKLIFSCNLNISRNDRSKLALIRNLNFYEVLKKQIINSVDLQHSILRKIQYKFDSIEATELNGTVSQASDILASSKAAPSQSFGSIIFGKYIYQSRNDKIVFLLIKCWNCMVVIKRGIEGLCLHAEYEGVKSFHIIKGDNYQTYVSISFLHTDQNERTNFQENAESLKTFDLPTADVYRKMTDRIKLQKSELLVHKTISRKEFSKLKSTQLFGHNFLRTARLEELQILSKCGNSWIKLTANDDIVIGIPIVNNCSSRLTILRNFRAVLQGMGDVIHSFKLYQLKNSFCNIENIQSFLNNSEFDDQNSNNFSWRQCLDYSLRPEEFSVLVLKLKIQENFFECGLVNAPLFIFYDVYSSNKTFNQKCFLTTISFHELFSADSHKLKFDETNFHRDLLAVISSSYETEIRLEYVLDGCEFENFLCRKLGFDRISENQNIAEEMEVDQQANDDLETAKLKKVMFYNKNKDSFWHGTLLEISHFNDSSVDVRMFTTSREKSKVFQGQLRWDLKASCAIKNVEENVKNMSVKLSEFEGALRDECSSCLETYSNSSAMNKDQKDKDKNSLYNNFHLQQLKTDLLFKDLLS